MVCLHGAQNIMWLIRCLKKPGDNFEQNRKVETKKNLDETKLFVGRP